jgi:diguanylate cyclase (GGDEF)-like protein
LLDAAVEAAMEIAERIRKKVTDKVESYISVTVSLGVTSTTFGSYESAELIHQADQALYASKKKGRNRVTTYEHKSVYQDQLRTHAGNH